MPSVHAVSVGWLGHSVPLVPSLGPAWAGSGSAAALLTHLHLSFTPVLTFLYPGPKSVPCFDLNSILPSSLFKSPTVLGVVVFLKLLLYSLPLWFYVISRRPLNCSPHFSCSSCLPAFPATCLRSPPALGLSYLARASPGW